MDGSTLSLVLESDAEDIHEPEFAAYSPLVSFDAFLVDRRVYGWVRLDADRLTDLLNAHENLRLVNVLVEDLVDGRTVTAEEAVIARGEIVAVVASGPRGDETRRLPTRAHAVVIEAGPYRVGGYVHATADGDPVARLRDAGPMIPLTDAWLEYRRGVERHHDRIETVIVNRDLATRIEVVVEPSAAPSD